ncbi:coatomer subunit delta-like isoform X2 [Artemia franciscana]|uniref:coatomer subunit delta-like isoform X2 n=1 Tax=Artemia franciscana TaxID=6661 RepID=UPI0032DACD22
MVLIAASLVTKNGKVLVSRHFVEISKSRIEGLLASFPKLITSGKASQQQHTLVETDAVRYVYQPLEKLYVVLITTKASNILEDLESLRLFAKIVQEYCLTIDEACVLDNSFQLTFAFDEVVALGYRESVNLSQIRTFTEMDSHDEKIHKSIMETQMKEAKKKARDVALEFRRAQAEGRKKSYGRPISSVIAPIISGETTSYPVSRPVTQTKALRLLTKSKDVDAFIDQLKSEGETVISPTMKANSIAANVPVVPSAPVRIRIEEEMILTARRDGGLEAMEVNGSVKLDIFEERYGKIRIQFENLDTKGIKMQTSPRSVDKEMFRSRCLVVPKNPDTGFAHQADSEIIRWKFQAKDDSFIPLTINCWPTENGRGGCDVNIEYELQDTSLELENVSIIIPLAPGSGTPVITECEGEYTIGHSSLQWDIPVINSNEDTGLLGFSASGIPGDFFPIKVSFSAAQSFANLRVLDVVDMETNESVKFTAESLLSTKQYEIV